MEANVLTKPGQIPRPVQSHSASFWNGASTGIGPSTPTNSSQNNAGVLSRLFDYGWCRNVFGKLGFCRTHDSEALFDETWTFDPNQIRDDNWGEVVTSLIFQSSKTVALIPFEELIKLTGDQIPPILQRFLEKYKSLYTQICNRYMGLHNTEERGKHLGLMKELEDEATGADPFLLTVVQNAYYCVVNKTSREPNLVAILLDFIADPLSGQLHEHISHYTVLQRRKVLKARKKVLKARLKRYLSGSDNKWDKPFDPSTTFLDDCLTLEPQVLAERLTEIDYELYRNLDIDSFHDKEQVLQTLIQREDSLSRSVAECLDMGLLNENRVFELAQHLCDKSNFLSMDAVRRGASLAQSSLGLKQQLQGLVNLEQQLNMAKPGLYPLSRAAKCAQLWKNTQLAEKYIDLCVCYTIERSGLTGTWAERSGSTKPPGTMAVREKASQSSLSGTLDDTASLDNMKMQYSPASPDKKKSFNPDGVLDHPGMWSLYGWSCCFGS